MDIADVSIIHHVGIVFLLIWLLSSFNCCHPFVYFVSLIYLYLVHDRYAMRLRRKVHFEERRHANQKRVLSDSESVRWLNRIVERIWPICMEEIVSQRIILPIIPWFLQKYKPWTVKKATVQNLYMGRSPPMITNMRVCRQSTGDDHLVLELGLNFRTADDMSAILAVKLTKRLGFGMWAKMHLTGMHVEGKVLVGVKFLPKWPFLGRLRVCFVEPPYFQMTVKPIFSHGLDVTEVPGIAGWLDKLLTLAFEETLVEPNMLVVDVEKFVSPQPETWFSVDAKEAVAYALVEIVEGSDMKPSDVMNGLADPYLKGQLGAYRFRTKTQKKTLSPKWLEEFKIPISSWDSPNVLEIEIRDKDHFVDDSLGDCSIKINDLRDGERHDMWLPLQNIKMGRLHLAIRVIEVEGKVTEQPCDGDASKDELEKNSFAAEKGDCSGELPEKSSQVADKFEPIDIEGQRETGIWVHHPGTDVAPQVWEPRKGKTRIHKDGEAVGGSIKSESYPNDTSSTDESLEGDKTKSRNPVKRGFRKIGSLFHRSPKAEDDKSRSFKERDDEGSNSPHENVRAVNAKGIGVNLVIEDNLPSPGQDSTVEIRQSGEESDPESLDKTRIHKDGESVGGSIKSESYPNDTSSTDESLEGDKTKSRNPVKRGFRKIGSLFHRSPKAEDDKSRSFEERDDEDSDSPHENVRPVNAKGIGANLVIEDNLPSPGQDSTVEIRQSGEESDPESPDKRKAKGTVKSILKHAGNSARGMRHALSRKESNEGRNRDLPVPSDPSGEGSIPSPGYIPEGDVSPVVPDISRRSSSLKSEDVPIQMDLSKADMDPVSPTGELKVDYRPARLATDTVDVNATDNIGVDESGRTAQETTLLFTGNQVIPSSPPK